MGALKKLFGEMLGKELVAKYGFIRRKNDYYCCNKKAKYLLQCELDEYWGGRGFNFYIRMDAFVELSTYGIDWDLNHNPREPYPMRAYILDGSELNKVNGEMSESLQSQLKNRVAYFKEEVLPVIDTIEDRDTFFRAVKRLDSIFGYSTFRSPWLYIQQGDYNDAKQVTQSRMDWYDERLSDLLHINERIDYEELKQRYPKEVEEYEKGYGKERVEYERLLQRLEKGDRSELEREIRQREQDAEKLCDIYFDNDDK